LFLPHYFRGEYYTAYQLMERRFGARVKAVAASTFLVTRVLAEGVRIAAIALVVTAALGTGQRTSILLIMALVLIYTFEGGMKAVIWTDVVQFLLYISGSVAAFFLLLHRIPGGWETIVQAAAPAHKFRVFDFSFSLTNPAKLYTFWSGVIGGTFFTMGSHGTDQTIVQRLLAAKSERESKLALLASGVVILAQFAATTPFSPISLLQRCLRARAAQSSPPSLRSPCPMPAARSIRWRHRAWSISSTCAA
jgi:Na+/proline symporter